MLIVGEGFASESLRVEDPLERLPLEVVGDVA